jgi:hypothetical protein
MRDDLPDGRDFGQRFPDLRVIDLPSFLNTFPSNVTPADPGKAPPA